MGTYQQQPPQQYYQQAPSQYYQPQQQQYYQQPQQPELVYVQQPQQQTTNNEDCLMACLGSLCVCLSANLLLNACLF